VFPELFSFDLLGSRHVYSYGVLLLSAATLGVSLCWALAPRRGLTRGDGASVALLAVAGGLLGSGLLDAAVHWRVLLSGDYRPGLVFYGGVLGAAPAVWLFARRFRIDLRALADLGAVALPAAHAVGRVGCLLGGCCHGGPAGSWPGIVYTDPRAPATALSQGTLPLHPVPIYEALGLTLIAAAMLTLLLLERQRGRLFLLYLACYALLRFSCEFLRADSERGSLGPLSTSQWIALAALCAVALAWRRARQREAPPH
jgi:phosphatidylglycerol:prolipoprotein diacylglycerol transferase